MFVAGPSMFKRKQPVDTRRHAIAAPEGNPSGGASPETKSQQKRGSVFGNFLGLTPHPLVVGV